MIANDLSPSATAAMSRNVELNGLGAPSEPEAAVNSTAPVQAHEKSDLKPKLGMVRINEGDAWYVRFRLHGQVYKLLMVTVL